MKKRPDICCSCLIRGGLAVVFVWGQVAFAETAPPGAEPLPWKDAMTVHELLYLDTEHALQLARDRRLAQQKRAGGSTPAPMPSMSSRPELLAIYGVGKRLLAEIRADGRSLVYMNGKSGPLGRDTSQDMYLLKGISGRCVRLEREGNGLTLCLNQPGGADQ